MSKKLEEDYQSFTKKIDRLADEEIKRIREKAEAVKEEAARVGQAVEASLNKKDSARKKVNT